MESLEKGHERRGVVESKHLELGPQRCHLRALSIFRMDFQSDSTMTGLSTSGRLINQDMFIYFLVEERISVLFQLNNLEIKNYPLEMILNLWNLTQICKYT